jgi:hypothetical protein
LNFRPFRFSGILTFLAFRRIKLPNESNFAIYFGNTLCRD